MTDDPNDTPAPSDASDPDVLWDRWPEVDALLEQVLDLPVEERVSFVEREAKGDVELIEAVLALANDSEASGQTGLLPGDRVVRAALGERGVDPEDPSALLGTRAGAYRLTKVIGSGGMGSVFAGERDDETFERSVAVKVLKRSVATDDVVARFGLERQILASLNHPAIAQLIDGGVTEDGRPYFVMELVDGLRIDEWADRNRLGVEERLRLVLGVMEAVEHAHRHLVIHRDLKPSNILVTQDGAPKLLDFGIAKLLDDSGVAPAETRTAGRYLTPEYAAPEQLLGEPASTQTDVYSIGLLLYELLTGSRPYQHEGRTMLEHVVEGGEATAPSAALSPADTSGAPIGSTSVGPDAVYSARNTTHSELTRQLRGDIDAILMRALRARPGERYSTVSAFREDIERHLAGHAVSARGDARGYRLRTFVRRNRWAVGSAAAVFLLVTGSAIGLGLQRGNLIEQRRLAEEATLRANQDAETALATSNFLVELFESSDPSQRLGDTLTARAILERGTERIETELVGQPRVRAELLGTLAQVHTSLGELDEGLALHQRAVRLAEDSVADRSVFGHRLLGLARAQDNRRDFDAAVSSFRRTVRVAESVSDTTLLVFAQLGLGSVLSRVERPDEAEEELSEGLRVASVVGLSDDVSWAAQRTLAGILRRQGEEERADSLLSVIVTERRQVTSDPVGYMRALNDLAVVRAGLERYTDAADLYREAVDSANAVLGPAHPETLMYQLNRGSAFHRAAAHDEAVAAYAEAIAATRVEWPDGHWQTTRLLMNTGATLIDANRPEEAIPALSEALDMSIEQLGPYHAWTNMYRAWLGVAARLTDRHDGADQMFDWAFEGLSTYQGLDRDRDVQAMIRALVRDMRAQGLNEDVERFAELLAGTP